MSLLDVVIPLMLIGVVVVVYLAARGRSVRASEMDGDAQISRTAIQNDLPQNVAAIIFKLIGGLTLIAGLLVTGSDGFGIVMLSTLGLALGAIATGMCIQYLFDIRNILLGRERND